MTLEQVTEAQKIKGQNILLTVPICCLSDLLVKFSNITGMVTKQLFADGKIVKDDK